MIITIDLNGCTDDQKQLAAELMKRGESEEVIEQAIRILHVDFAEKGDFTAYGKHNALINKAIENLNNALRENNENAKAAVVAFRNSGKQAERRKRRRR